MTLSSRHEAKSLRHEAGAIVLTHGTEAYSAVVGLAVIAAVRWRCFKPARIRSASKISKRRAAGLARSSDSATIREAWWRARRGWRSLPSLRNSR